jgi:sulfur-oxidizing protein SoxZ
MSTPRLRLPRSARPGEVIEVRTLLDHPMTSAISAPGPRNMLARFEASFEGEPVLSYDFGNGSAANPTFTFHVRAERSGTFVFVWTHEDGTTFRAEHALTVL